MAFYEVNYHPPLVRYRTSFCTKATVFLVAVLSLSFVAELWIERSSYEEQPVVQFQYQVLLLASTSFRGDYVAWSTYPHMNNMLGSNLRIPAVSTSNIQSILTPKKGLIMGLCTSKTTVTLDPSAHTLSADQASRAAVEGVSPEGNPILDEGILMVQPIKSKAEGGEGGTKSSGLVNQTAKSYLELGGKGGGEGEAQTSREAEEEDEADDGDQVEELIDFSDSEGSLRSEFLE